MTVEEKDRQILIAYRIEKARTAAGDARFLIENDKLHLAVNRIYYAIFYAISALALKYRYQSSKHQQLIGWFNKTFVKEGILSKAFSASPAKPKRASTPSTKTSAPKWPGWNT